jgi:hypothetical protein
MDRLPVLPEALRAPSVKPEALSEQLIAVMELPPVPESSALTVPVTGEWTYQLFSPSIASRLIVTAGGDESAVVIVNACEPELLPCTSSPPW